jgi:hypothetical protein
MTDGLERKSVGGTPWRDPGSIRRTSSIDMLFPDGPSGDLEMTGRARDLVTMAVGSRVVATSEFEARLAPDGTLRSIAVGSGQDLSRLIGCRRGEQFRDAIQEAMPLARSSGSLLYFLLDDVPPASLISGFARVRQQPQAVPRTTAFFARMENVCSGWRTGSSAFEISASEREPAWAADLANGDSLAWHPLGVLPAGSMRRRRRVDLDLRSGAVDAMFRDSHWEPNGRESVVHEYDVTAQFDESRAVFVHLRAVPHVLPFAECPAAAPIVSRLEGLPAVEFRETVVSNIRGVACCTHLNDMLRALADVPALTRVCRLQERA